METHFPVSPQANTSNAHANGECSQQMVGARRGAASRSDVLRQVSRRAASSDAGKLRPRRDSAHGGGDAARDVGEQALMRGSEPHVHVFVRGWSSLTTGVGFAGDKALTGVPLSLPRPRRHARDVWIWLSPDHTSIGSIRAMAHMKPASSRATAVMATVLRLPRAIKARYRLVRRACAFHAVSLTSSGMSRVAK